MADFASFVGKALEQLNVDPAKVTEPEPESEPESESEPVPDV